MQIAYSTQPQDIQNDRSYEERRVKALRLIYDLKFTFQMENLARAFLHQYVSSDPQPASGHTESLITERILRRA